jgi:hypothetical protein
MRRALIITIALMLVMAACASGDAGREATQAPGPAESEPAGGGGGGDTDPTESPTGDADDPLSGFRDDEASAVVTIDGDRYEFDGLYCVTMGGALGAASVGADPSVNISLPPMDWESSPEDWDPPSVRVQSDEPYADFQAGGDTIEFDTRLEAGMSQVDSFDSDGYRASGTATFVNLAIFDQPLEPVSGTFEVSCPRP